MDRDILTLARCLSSTATDGRPIISAGANRTRLPGLRPSDENSRDFAIITFPLC
jgi:hypothetical protein